MAKRGKPTDLLGSFFKSAMQQLDSVREAVVQRSKAGRIQLDLTLLKRKRKDALAELGEAVARMAANGVIDEEEFPQLSGPLSRLEAVDEQIAAAERRARNASLGVEDDRGDEPIEEYDDPDANLDPDPDPEAGADADAAVDADHADPDDPDPDDPDFERTRPGFPRASRARGAADDDARYRPRDDDDDADVVDDDGAESSDSKGDAKSDGGKGGSKSGGAGGSGGDLK